MENKKLKSMDRETYQKPLCEMYSMELEDVIAASGDQLQDVDEEEAAMVIPNNKSLLVCNS